MNQSQMVTQALGNRIAALAIENVALQARVSGLEAELQNMKKPAPNDKKQPNSDKIWQDKLL